MNIGLLESKPLCLEILLTVELFIHPWYFITEAATIIVNCDLGLGTEVLNSVRLFMNGLRSLGDIMNALQWMALKGGGQFILT